MRRSEKESVERLDDGVDEPLSVFFGSFPLGLVLVLPVYGYFQILKEHFLPIEIRTVDSMACKLHIKMAKKPRKLIQDTHAINRDEKFE